MQEVLVYIVLFLAIGYLVKKFFFTKDKNKGCGTDCKC